MSVNDKDYQFSNWPMPALGDGCASPWKTHHQNVFKQTKGKSKMPHQGGVAIGNHIMQQPQQKYVQLTYSQSKVQMQTNMRDMSKEPSGSQFYSKNQNSEMSPMAPSQRMDLNSNGLEEYLESLGEYEEYLVSLEESRGHPQVTKLTL